MAGIRGMGTPNSLKPTVNPQAQDITKIIQGSVPNISQPVQATQPPAAQAAPQEMSIEEIFASEGLPIPGQQPSQEQSIEEIFASEGLSIPEQEPSMVDDVVSSVKKFGTRAKASFATDPEVKLDYLKKVYGKENVRIEDEEFEVKKNGKWELFDEPELTVTDAADFSRDVVEGTVSNVLTAGAIAANPVLGVGGLPLIRAASGAAGVASADVFSRQVLGLDNQSSLGDYAISSAAEVAGGFGEDYLKKLVKARIPKKLQSPEELYKDSITEIRDASEALKELGILKPIDDSGSVLMVNQLVSRDPNARKIVEGIAATPAFNQIKVMQEDSFENAAKGHVMSFAKLNPKFEGGNEFKNAVTAAREAQGKLIGEARDAAVKAAGNKKIPVPELSGKIDTLISELGITKTKPFDRTVLAGSTIDRPAISYALNDNDFKTAKDLTSEVWNNINSGDGTLTVGSLVGQYNKINGLFGTFPENPTTQSERTLKNYVGKLRRTLRDEVVTKVNDLVPNSKYEKALEIFSTNAEFMDDIDNLIKSNDVSTDFFVDRIFKPGKDSLDRLNAVEILTADRPEILEYLKGHWIAKTIGDSKPDKWSDVFLKDKQIAEKVFGPEPLKTIQNINKISKTMKESDISALPTPEKAGLIKNLALAFGGGRTAMGNAGVEILAAADPEKNFYNALNKDGIDAYLKYIPNDDRRTTFRKLFQDYILTNKVLKTGSAASVPATGQFSREKREEINIKKQNDTQR